MSAGIGRWLVVLAAGLGLMIAGAAYGASSSSTTTPPPKPAPPVFIVIKVTNTKGDVSYEVTQSKGVPDRVKQMVAEYKAALDRWKKDKEAALIKKTKFDEKQPVQGKVERVDTSPAVFKTQELARIAAEKLTQDMENRKKGVTTTTTTDAPPKPAIHTPPTGQVVKPPDTTDENKDTTATGDTGAKNP